MKRLREYSASKKLPVSSTGQHAAPTHKGTVPSSVQPSWLLQQMQVNMQTVAVGQSCGKAGG
jgi:hypothetical protein